MHPTLEAHRLVGLAAIAVAGLGLFASGGHQMLLCEAVRQITLLVRKTTSWKLRVGLGEPIFSRLGILVGIGWLAATGQAFSFVHRNLKRPRAIWHLRHKSKGHEMSCVQSRVSDMLTTVKSREVQRGMSAAMGGRPSSARNHFLAAAHLELVLAGDYEEAGDAELARRSRISAASCFWRAGETNEAQAIFDDLLQTEPQRAGEIQEVIDDLKTM